MSEFLNELGYINEVIKSMEEVIESEFKTSKSTRDWHVASTSIINLIDSLGENARRMLEIGILQDRLVELGLTSYVLSHNRPYFMIKRGKECIEINFGSLWVGIIIHRENGERSRVFERLYSNENCQINWQEDLINQIKELIK